MERRAFLGSLLGLAATPLITPRRSFFFFGQTWKPKLSLYEMHVALAKSTYYHMAVPKPQVILMNQKDYKLLWDLMGAYEVVNPENGEKIKAGLWCHGKLAEQGYDNVLFNGRPVVPSDLVLKDFPHLEPLDLRKHFA